MGYLDKTVKAIYGIPVKPVCRGAVIGVYDDV